MRSPVQFWTDLNGVKQLLAIVTIVIPLLVGAGFVIADHKDLPDRVEVIEEVQMQQQHQLDDISLKQDQTLCILTQTEEEHPLTCIEG